VARKILSAYATTTGLTPPEDETIVSLFLSSLPTEATNESLIRHFFHTIGIESAQIKSVVVVPTSKCAFVNFVSRSVAEDAASRCSLRVQIAGKDVLVRWGRSKPKKNPSDNNRPPLTKPIDDPNSSVGEREIASSM
jgi:pre-mRNA-splicing factor RBM22/SLT11